MTDERMPESAESGQETGWEPAPSTGEVLSEHTSSMDADSPASAAFEAEEREITSAVDHPELTVPPLPEVVQTDGEHADALPSAPSLGDRIKAFLGIGTDTSARMYSLTHAINIAPEAAVNYVLRGELYLERGQYPLAAEDFHAAVSLAEADLQRDDKSLGLLAQSIQDRALTGYEEAIRRGENGYNKRKSKVE